MDEATRSMQLDSQPLHGHQRIWLPFRNICLPYVLFGVGWVVYGDSLLLWLAPDALWLQNLEIWKGFVLVLLTASLLFLLIHHQARSTHQVMQRLREHKLQFREMTERIREVFAVYDLQRQCFSYVAPGYARLWHRQPESLLADPFDWLLGVPMEEP